MFNLRGTFGEFSEGDEKRELEETGFLRQSTIQSLALVCETSRNCL